MATILQRVRCCAVLLLLLEHIYDVAVKPFNSETSSVPKVKDMIFMNEEKVDDDDT